DDAIAPMKGGLTGMCVRTATEQKRLVVRSPGDRVQPALDVVLIVEDKALFLHPVEPDVAGLVAHRDHRAVTVVAQARDPERLVLRKNLLARRLEIVLVNLFVLPSIRHRSARRMESEGIELLWLPRLV